MNHRDFESRNVLRKRWCRLRIIGFAFLDVEHTCPEWRECSELKDAGVKLELERLPLHHRSGMSNQLQV